MHLFLDTANLDEIREIAAWGVLDGITTNPTLVSKEKQDFKKLVQEICKIVPGPVSAEVVATDAEGMIKEGKEIAEMFAIHDLDTKVLAASIRTPVHVTQAALAGADIATMPYKVFKQLVSHPLTDKGVESFLADWAKAKDTVGAVVAAK